MVAYRARPEGDTLLPVVLVVQEIFRDICRRLAKEGYLAIAPICSPGKAMCPSKVEDHQKIIAKRGISLERGLHQRCPRPLRPLVSAQLG